MVAETTVEACNDATANKNPDATVGIAANDSRNDANDAHKRTVADPGQASSSTLHPTGVGMVVTRSELLQQQQQQQRPRPDSEETKTMTAPDPRVLPQVFGDVTYAALLRYDRVPPDEFNAIVEIPWFPRTAVQTDTEKGFERLGLYA